MSFGGSKSKSKQESQQASSQLSQLNPFAQFAATMLLANFIRPEAFGDLGNFLGTGGILGTGGNGNFAQLPGKDGEPGARTPVGTGGGLPAGTIPQESEILPGGVGTGNAGLDQLFANLRGNLLNQMDMTNRLNSFRRPNSRPSFL